MAIRAFERVTELRAGARTESFQISDRAARGKRWAGLAGCVSALALLLAGSLLSTSPADAASSRHAKRSHRSDTAAVSHHKQTRTAARTKRRNAARAASSRRAGSSAAKATKPELSGELGVLQQAIALARKGKLADASTLAKSLSDPAAQKLVEWVALRDGDSQARFDRYEAFIRANPDWPNASLRRRAEARLWQERRDGPTVRGFIGEQPMGAMGRLALARVLMSDGDRAAAEQEVRAAWRSGELSAEIEAAALDTFDGVLTRADHTARMNRRIGKKDFGGAMRAARRLGDGAVSIVKACSSTESKSSNARKLLDAVPSEARDDLGYKLCRIQSLLQNDGVTAATQVALSAAADDLQHQDTDEWWRKRRTLARKLLDLGDAKAAYAVASSAAAPDNPFYRADAHFMAGWIALRFLDDPAAALKHFAHIDEGSTNPIVLARAGYWRGRAYEAAGQTDQMRANYQAAARHSTAYYGQLARERLGLGEPELRTPPEPAHATSLEVLRAAELLYTLGERETALSFLTGFADQSDDAPGIAAIASLAARNNDARAVLLVGKAGLARGLPFDVYAFPDIGVPHYKPIGPSLDRSLVYSIVRTESEFNQRDVSPAKAVGLMQITPEAGRDTAKRFGVSYDWKRLVNDPVYNTQMGAGELAALLKDYRGSYIMSFAGYNAGRGRVQEWVARYGDPRDAKVDAVDWVERIPFSETRNYVQRVMENLQVYRVRFGEGANAATLEPDLSGKAAQATNSDRQAREATAR